MPETAYQQYKMNCDDWLRSAMKRPGMYWQTLDEWFAAISGHDWAYTDLEIIKHNQSFNECFKLWLKSSKGISSSGCGWACKLNDISEERGINPLDMFYELVGEFLLDWLVQP